jgi:hypothetical protein
LRHRFARCNAFGIAYLQTLIATLQSLTGCDALRDVQRCGMKTPNQFAEFVAAVGSVSKAAKVLGIEKTRIWRLSKGSVPVRFEELDRVRIALDAIRFAQRDEPHA